MGLVNILGHAVTFYLGDQKYVLLSDAKRPPRLRLDIQAAGTVRIHAEQGVVDVPIVRSNIVDRVSGLPEPALAIEGVACEWCGERSCGDENNIRNCLGAPKYLVPRLIVDALPQRSDLVAPHALIREGGRVIGCRAVNRA